MHSIRRAATRATLTSTVSATAPKTQAISSALRALNFAAARSFSVAAPRAFSRSVAFRDQFNPAEDAAATRETPREQQEKFQAPSDHVLFVQNYSFDIKAEDITEAFGKYGEVVGVSMPPKKTYCFVYFKEGESVNVAAENVDGTFWHGRRIVAKAREAGSRNNRSVKGGSQGTGAPRRAVYDGPPTSTVYVGNIAFEASDADLNDLFSALKDVKDVRVAVDRATGWPRGFAHADFHTVEAATTALEFLNTQQIRGRDLKVSYAPEQRETGRFDRNQNKRPRNDRGDRGDRGNYRGGRRENSQRQVEERVEAEHQVAEQAQKEQKPEAGKQDMNWNA